MGCAPSYPIPRGPIVYELPYLYDTSGEYNNLVNIYGNAQEDKVFFSVRD